MKKEKWNLMYFIHIRYSLVDIWDVFIYQHFFSHQVIVNVLLSPYDITNKIWSLVRTRTKQCSLSVHNRISISFVKMENSCMRKLTIFLYPGTVSLPRIEAFVTEINCWEIPMGKMFMCVDLACATMWENLVGNCTFIFKLKYSNKYSIPWMSRNIKIQMAWLTCWLVVG